MGGANLGYFGLRHRDDADVIVYSVIGVSLIDEKETGLWEKCLLFGSMKSIVKIFS